MTIINFSSEFIKGAVPICIQNDFARCRLEKRPKQWILEPRNRLVAFVSIERLLCK